MLNYTPPTNPASAFHYRLRSKHFFEWPNLLHDVVASERLQFLMIEGNEPGVGRSRLPARNVVEAHSVKWNRDTMSSEC